jgi:hypothetical protein
LVPALRLSVIRQGVEDFDVIELLAAAWRKAERFLPVEAGRDVAAQARQALLDPVMFSPMSGTTSPDRVEAIRLLAGNELEVAEVRPAVIVFPRRVGSRMGVAGRVEAGTRMTINVRPVAIGPDGRFELPLTNDELAAGVRWTAEQPGRRKQWQWPGLR